MFLIETNCYKLLTIIHKKVVVSSNSDRRKLYSRLQLLKMDIEEAVANNSLENRESTVIETLIKDIEELSSQQRIIPLKGQKTVSYIILSYRIE